MTDCGASSESTRIRTGSAVSSFEGCDAIRSVCPRLRRRSCGRTLAWLSMLVGLTMSSASGDLMSLDSSSLALALALAPSASLAGCSCASSSICLCQSRMLVSLAAASTSVATVPLLSTGEGSTVEG